MNQVQIDWGSIVPNLGIIGSLLLNFISLYSLRKSEQHSRQHSLNSSDYKERRDFILSNLSEYIEQLDAHALSFMALTDEEYEGKDIEKAEKLYSLETTYYKIKLMLNTENQCFEEMEKSLDTSILLARNIRAENSFAELFTNGLRTPEKALDIAKRALEYTQSETVSDNLENGNKERLDFIADAIKARDKHLKSYLTSVEKLSKEKESLILVTRKYLFEEKEQLSPIKKKVNR